MCENSRTGYVMTLGGCPLHWVSNLHTEIYLSILEAEYIALSRNTRNLLTLRQMIQEGGTKSKMDFASHAIVHSAVFEGNNGVLGLTT